MVKKPWPLRSGGFRVTPAGHARHRDGFEVGLVDRHHAFYDAPGRRAVVAVEFGGPTMLIHAPTLRWDESDEPVPLPDQDVVERVRAGMDVLGYRPEVST